MKANRVVIVGRPNVGKSTLFNRIVGKRRSVVDPTPGVTRDTISEKAEWNGIHFLIIDSGGIEQDGTLQKEILNGVEQALLQADRAVVVVEPTLTPLDYDVANMVRRSGVDTILVVNKVDNPADETSFWEASELGLGEPIPISATLGYGTGDMLDRIVEGMPETVEKEEALAVRIAIVGRPNVGKSTFLNKITGDNIVIVNEIPGTTRDAVDVEMRYKNYLITLTDTAGLLHKQKGIAYYSAVRSFQAIEKSDVVVLMVDATLGIKLLEKRIAERTIGKGCGLLIAVNKWDTIENKETNTAKDVELLLRNSAPFLKFAPVLFISALTGQRVRNVLDIAIEIHKQSLRRIPTPELNSVIQKLYAKSPPPYAGHSRPKFLYSTQVGTAPPKFILFLRNAGSIRSNWMNFVVNSIRKQFGYMGVPLRVEIREAR